MTVVDLLSKKISQLTKEAKRANLEVQKLYIEKLRYAELSIYKNIAQRNPPQQHIGAMLTSNRSIQRIVDRKPPDSFRQKIETLQCDKVSF